jgi:hypothetical protein
VEGRTKLGGGWDFVRIRGVIPVVLVLLGLAGCSSGGGSAAPVASATYAAEPSVSARQVCSSEAEDDIQAALGIKVTKTLNPTWTDHVYACRYVYQVGTMVLSVKELPDATATAAYFTSLQSRFGASSGAAGLGEGAFIGRDGSTVVRKDFKVLSIDVSGLPEKLGQPLISRSEVAYRVAVVIMGCWTGN